mmetsp:Transcript_6895/g.17633  ORF Transcript_6895/g.17633 Transcript_6895/m.17633 type:complete len:211 (-) Transcript_6895:482-1114(-)|eukprot:jgi/Tetstr1/447585/TSEL_003737.t1
MEGEQARSIGGGSGGGGGVGGVCVVCQGALQRPLLAQPCGHALCSTCMCRHLRHQRRCPTCRAPVLRAEVAAIEPGSWCMSLRHANAAYYLDFRTENSSGDGVEAPRERLCDLFGIPPGRLKLIHRGKIVTGDADLQTLAATGATLTLVGSSPGQAELAAASWRGAVAALWRCVAAFVEALQLWAAPLVHLARAFFHSVDPQWKPDEERQ